MDKHTHKDHIFKNIISKTKVTFIHTYPRVKTGIISYSKRFNIIYNLSWRIHTLHILQATSLYPLASNRFMISPTSPLWTPSGFTMIKVRSALASAILENPARMCNKVATMCAIVKKKGKGRTCTPF